MQTRLYGYDGMGSTRLLVDGGTGATLWQGAWSAWGAAQNTGGSVGGACPSSFGYKGQTGAYCDMDTGLLKMGARYYAPCIGRFLSRDPSGFSAGTNLYAYCASDPVNFFDPNGCFAVSNDSIWKGIGLAEQIERAVGSVGIQTGGIPGALMGAHDAVWDWGTAAGSSKASPLQTWLAAGKAALHFTNAVIACAAPALAITRELEAAEGAVRACSGSTCFVAGTLVWMGEKEQDGQWLIFTKPIEQVKKGEYAVTKNAATGNIEFKQVTWTRTRTSDAVLNIALKDSSTQEVVETITTTREHPFYVDGKGFVPAGGLAVGNSIVTRAGPPLVVQSITWNRRPEGYTVYNFEVEDDHSYFVGNVNGGAWVHNYDNEPPLYKSPTRWGNRLKNKVWNAAKDSDGVVRDPVSGNVMDRNQPWHMGHKPGWEHSKHIRSLLRRNASRETFLTERANPDIYRPELPSSNMSHAGEGDEDFWP